MDVVLLRWPQEQERRDELGRGHRPRLLLVEGGVPAPLCMDVLEDWIRLPADEDDIRARVEVLGQRRAAPSRNEPELDADGVLRFVQRCAPLPPVEARLTRCLVDRFGAVVSRDQLARAGWPEGAPGRNALDVHMLRLRRRIAPLGLGIKTVRSRGYLLEVQLPPVAGEGRHDASIGAVTGEPVDV